MPLSPRIDNLVITGGGPAAWGFAALVLRLAEPGHLVVRVVDEGAGHVPVCLSTLPSVRHMHAELGLTDADLVRQARGSFKLGERFENWSISSATSFVPYGDIGADLGPVRFHQQLARLADGHGDGDYAGHALASHAAARGRIALPPHDPRSILSTLDHGLHLDTGAYAGLLRQLALAHGATAVAAPVAGVERDGEDDIRALRLADGSRLEADFFVDATPEGRLSAGRYETWTTGPVFVPRETLRQTLTDTPPPFTRNVASADGWSRIIPLRDEIVEIRHSLAEPGSSEGSAGWRPESWRGNCLSIGPAACSPDPLAGAEMSLVASAARRFVRLWPTRPAGRAQAQEYNRLFRQEVENIRDFTDAIYRAQTRDEPIWTDARRAPVSGLLSHSLALFESRGRLARREFPVHDETRWTATLLAMGLRPRRHDPQADQIDGRMLVERRDRIRKMVEDAAAVMPAHGDVLDRIIAGDPIP